MFRKLFALEVAALADSEENNSRFDRQDNDFINQMRDVFAPRTADYGSMWSVRSAG